MAVQEKILETNLRIKYDMGVDDKGNIVSRNKTYSNFKTSATAQELNDFKNQLLKLQKNPALEVKRINESLIYEA
ncbi:MAG: DUF1659 domain-containing protein [Peptostreptococcaceae bacterium]|nr:DUF1659 domain-containing protein [Peptostreptococcaceae bacterium]